LLLVQEATMNLVILGRDGVINYEAEDGVRTPEQWRAIPGSMDAISRLNRAGFRVVVATNQSGLKRNLYDIETLNLVHQKMQHELAEVGGAVEAIFLCACLPEDDCECYMPRPGMLLEIAHRLRVSLEDVPVIGDALRDVGAARAAGARPILLRTAGLPEPGSDPEVPAGVEVYDDLAAAVDALLEALEPD
jgi:D-glycero-D-manno-heptose 1,7-bisphosphate phosphatase